MFQYIHCIYIISMCLKNIVLVCNGPTFSVRLLWEGLLYHENSGQDRFNGHRDESLNDRS